MTNSLVMLIVQLIVIGVLCWAAYYITTALAVPEPLGRIVRTIVMVLCVAAVLILLLNFIGVSVGSLG